MAYPRAGKHYPGSVGEFQAWFRTDADCLDYLEWLRWPDGFVCPSCGHEGGWRLGDGRFMCPACSTRSSVTAGTIFDQDAPALGPTSIARNSPGAPSLVIVKSTGRPRLTRSRRKESQAS